MSRASSPWGVSVHSVWIATVMLIATMTVIAIGYLLYRRFTKGQEGGEVSNFAQL